MMLIVWFERCEPPEAARRALAAPGRRPPAEAKVALEWWFYYLKINRLRVIRKVAHAFLPGMPYLRSRWAMAVWEVLRRAANWRVEG